METNYQATALCLIDDEGSVVMWLPYGLKYSASRSLAELGSHALVLFDVDVTYKSKPHSAIVCVQTDKERVYPDKTKAIIDSVNDIKVIFRRGELFRKVMAVAEEMGLNVVTIQVEVTERLFQISRKENGKPKFFEDFRKQPTEHMLNTEID